MTPGDGVRNTHMASDGSLNDITVPPSVKGTVPMTNIDLMSYSGGFSSAT